MMRIVVLVSGNGSTLQAIIDACATGAISGRVVAVLSDKSQAYGLVRAREADIAAKALDPSAFNDRETFDHHLMEQIDSWQPDLLVLAGYMRILSDAFVRHYKGRILNIHPSLLPLYPGLHTYRRAIENGDTEHGTSVHFVTEALDGGPLILQARVPILPTDNTSHLRERTQCKERVIYPLAIGWFCAGRLQMRDGRAWLDDKPVQAGDGDNLTKTD